MSDTPAWLYRQYRSNLRRNHNRTTGKGRDLYRLEKLFYFWPMWAWCLIQRKRMYPADTTTKRVEPTGSSFYDKTE